MANFNKVILPGNHTRDPQLPNTPKAVAIAKLGLAVNRTWKNEAGETKEEVTFVDVDAFARQAEVIGQYLKKGNPILIEGRLRLDTWDDKQTNQKRSRLGVVLESFQFLGTGRNEPGAAPAGPPVSRPTPEPAPAGGPGETHNSGNAPIEEDDVPF